MILRFRFFLLLPLWGLVLLIDSGILSLPVEEDRKTQVSQVELTLVDV